MAGHESCPGEAFFEAGDFNNNTQPVHVLNSLGAFRYKDVARLTISRLRETTLGQSDIESVVRVIGERGVRLADSAVEPIPLPQVA